MAVTIWREGLGQRGGDGVDRGGQCGAGARSGGSPVCCGANDDLQDATCAGEVR